MRRKTLSRRRLRKLLESILVEQAEKMTSKDRELMDAIKGMSHEALLKAFESEGVDLKGIVQAAKKAKVGADSSDLPRFKKQTDKSGRADRTVPRRKK